jgi:glycosyltransferase involved in cell wall biosynthesis
MNAPIPHNRNFRMLMTVDAVGGVWRYAMDLAKGLRAKGVETIFAVFGPPPSSSQRHEAEAIGKLIWAEAPLDWMVEKADHLRGVQAIIRDLAEQENVDLLHLNLPSQAAGLQVDVPVAVVSHSCVASWFMGVRSEALPASWHWHLDLNRAGFRRADSVVSPSLSHAALLRKVYGPIDRLSVIPNASRVVAGSGHKQDVVFAAGRWWDEGKNGAVLDAAASSIVWPVVMAGASRGPNGQQITLRHATGREELSHAETMGLMAEAAIVVSPSLYEPFGLAALEAARHGSALVLSDIPTYRELWENAALFADPKNPASFAQAVNCLIDDPVMRERLARRAQALSERFSVEAQSDAFIRLYGRLLSASPISRAAE